MEKYFKLVFFENLLKLTSFFSCKNERRVERNLFLSQKNCYSSVMLSSATYSIAFLALHMYFLLCFCTFPASNTYIILYVGA